MRSFIPLLLFIALAVTSQVWCADTPVPVQPPTPAAATATPAAHLSPTATSPAEAALGKKVCEEIEKECKPLDDKQAVARLNTIANWIAPLTQRPDVTYHCKVLNSRDINAESIPGGYIYVTKGLLDAVESDDELAGVLAHEIAHNSLYHVMKKAKQENRANIGQILGILAAIFANQRLDSSAMPIALVSQYVKTAVLNGYSVEIEEQADLNGLMYLSKQNRYDPAGMYSVMLGFQQMESVRPQETGGSCFKDHPDTVDRVHYLEVRMKELGIKPNLWHVIHFQSVLVPVEDGKKGYTVRLGTVDVITFIASDGGLDAKARATSAMEAINACLYKSFIQQFDVVVDINENTAVLSLPNDPVLTITKSDAAAAGTTLEYLANRAKINIQNTIIREKTRRGW